MMFSSKEIENIKGLSEGEVSAQGAPTWLQ